jgi:hypothetical protein
VLRRGSPLVPFEVPSPGIFRGRVLWAASNEVGILNCGVAVAGSVCGTSGAVAIGIADLEPPAVDTAFMRAACRDFARTLPMLPWALRAKSAGLTSAFKQHR